MANRKGAGYTGDSLDLKIVIAFLIGLALYNAIELIVLILVTFNKYRGLYFWSMVISGVGIMPYSLGFLIKFFQCELRLFCMVHSSSDFCLYSTPPCAVKMDSFAG